MLPPYVDLLIATIYTRCYHRMYELYEQQLIASILYTRCYPVETPTVTILHIAAIYIMLPQYILYIPNVTPVWTTTHRFFIYLFIYIKIYFKL